MSTKVMTIVGTRPEIIKLSRVMAQLDKNVEHILVHTGQNYDFELNEIFFKELGIKKPDYFLNAVGKTTAETIGNILIKSDEIFEKVNPDAVLLYGDTNSCLSVISAKRRQIPIFHMEAGNRCFDQRVPSSIPSGLSCAILIIIAGKFKIEDSSVIVPLSEITQHEVFCKAI